MTAAYELSLPDSLEIAHCAGYKLTLDQALASDAAQLNCDAGALQRIDTAGLQMLLAAQAQCQRQQRVWRWSGDCARLIAAAEGLGLASALQLDQSEQLEDA